MSVIEVLINAEQAAKGKFKINEGDYLDDEGLYHSRVCQPIEFKGVNYRRKRVNPSFCVNLKFSSKMMI